MTGPTTPAASPRWWIPRGKAASTYGDDFLPNPEDAFGRVINPDVHTIESLAEVACVVLLGEPGSGKSTDIRRAFDAARDAGRAVVWIDCRDLANSESLARSVRDEQLIANATSAAPVTLYVDSLDEGLLATDTLSVSFMDELRRFSPLAMRLRIACRDGEWPMTFEEDLRAHWNRIHVFELAPLTLDSVRQAARRSIDDADAFLAAATAAGARLMLAIPVTLNLLLELYGRERTLPARRVELYGRGINALSEEHNELRRERLGPSLTAAERFAIAARCAAFMVLCNRTAIWRGIDYGDIPPTDLPEAELAGGKEPIDDESMNAVAVTARALHETFVVTAMFPSRGSRRVGWLHRSFAEYLAARWVARHRLDTKRIESLFFVSVEERRRVPPQLRETASWLAAMRKDVFQLLLEHDPSVLLLSDILELTSEDRERLVAAVLDAAERHENPGGGARLNNLLARLDYSGLANQLRPELAPNAQVERKEFALRIIAATRLSAVVEEVARLTFDPNETTDVRVLAVEALARSGSDEAVLYLMQLVLDAPGDENQRILGWVLDSLWPDHLGFHELLSLLEAVKNEAHVGAYQRFLGNLGSTLGATEARALIEWLGAQDGIASGLNRIASAALTAAWANVNSNDDYSMFVKVLGGVIQADWNYLESSEGRPLTEVLLRDTDRRRRLLLELLSLEGRNPRLGSAVLLHGGRVRTKDDVPWALRLLSQPDALPTHLAGAADGLATFVSWFLDTSDGVMTSELLAAIPHSAALQARFGPLQFEINSPEADRARETQAMHDQIRAQMNERRPPLHPPPAARIEAGLAASEAGDPNGWLRVDHDLSLDPADETADPWRADTRDARGWQHADDPTRDRIIEAASAYLRTASPIEDEWLGSSNRPYHIVSAFRALRLLYDERPDAVDSLDDATVARWVPVIVDYHAPRRAALDAKERLLQRAYARVPDRVLQILSRVLKAEDARFNGYVDLDAFAALWDSRFAQSLLQLVEAEEVSAAGGARLLDLLIENAPVAERARARQLAHHLLRRGTSGDVARAARAGAILLLSPTDDWAAVWDEIQTSPILKDIILAAAPNEERRSRLINELSEADLAELFLALESHFPHSTDPAISGVVTRSVEADDSARRWRDAVLQALAAKGTGAALGELQRLRKHLIHLPWLDWVIAGARQEVARLGWLPVSPQDLRFLSYDSRHRLIRDGTVSVRRSQVGAARPRQASGR